MFRQAAFGGLFLAGVLAGTAPAATGDMAAGFANPPDAAKPWCYPRMMVVE